MTIFVVGRIGILFLLLKLTPPKLQSARTNDDAATNTTQERTNLNKLARFVNRVRHREKPYSSYG